MADHKKMLTSDFGLENYMKKIERGEIGEQILPIDMSPMERAAEKKQAISDLMAKHPDFVLKKPTHPDRLIKREILKEIQNATSEYEKDFETGGTRGRKSSQLYGKYGAHPKERHREAVAQFFQTETGAVSAVGSNEKRLAYNKRLAEYEEKMKQYRRKRSRMMDDYDAQMEMLDLKYEMD
tara:strand:+ start:1032 stop:1574 length:543 start_codon:yes stop_codon:yes gene_type:complete